MAGETGVYMSIARGIPRMPSGQGYKNALGRTSEDCAVFHHPAPACLPIFPSMEDAQHDDVTVLDLVPNLIPRHENAPDFSQPEAR